MPEGAHEVRLYVGGVNQFEGGRSVCVSSRLGKAGREVGVSVGGAPAVFACQRVGGRKFELSLDASLVFDDLREVFEGFVDAEHDEGDLIKVRAKALHGPNPVDGAHFQFKDGPVPPVVEGDAT